MKLTLRSTLVLGAIAAATGAFAGTSHAQNPMPNRQDALFSAIDANKDGVVTKEEYDAYRDRMFARHDRNGDGFISQEEAMSGGGMGGGRGVMGSTQSGSMGGMRMGGGLANLDTDKDGKVSKAEWDARTAQLFAARDGNKDGKLTPDEMGPLHRMRMQP